MEPISTAIIAALAASALDVIPQAVRDAYDGLKSLIQEKCGEKSDLAEAVSGLEEKPDSKARQDVLKEEIEASGISTDADILATLAALVEELKKRPEGYGGSVKLNVSGEGHVFSGTGDVNIGGDVNMGS